MKKAQKYSHKNLSSFCHRNMLWHFNWPNSKYSILIYQTVMGKWLYLNTAYLSKDLASTLYFKGGDAITCHLLVRIIDYSVTSFNFTLALWAKLIQKLMIRCNVDMQRKKKCFHTTGNNLLLIHSPMQACGERYVDSSIEGNKEKQDTVNSVCLKWN